MASYLSAVMKAPASEEALSGSEFLCARPVTPSRLAVCVQMRWVRHPQSWSRRIPPTSRAGGGCHRSRWRKISAQEKHGEGGKEEEGKEEQGEKKEEEEKCEEKHEKAREK